jgi:D-alanyl-D-alanine dipeptidase
LSHCSFAHCLAQPCTPPAGAITDPRALANTIKADLRKKLVNLSMFIPGLKLDLRYATTNNFTKTVLYHNPVAYLRQEPAMGLKRVQEDLARQGLGLKIYDAYRPFTVSCRIWRLVPDRRYAANPRNGSNHNRGIAVDLTIIDLKTGRELDMGTPFDSFTDTAHHDFHQLPAQVLANRRLLKTTMRRYGFDIVPTEWWHYQWRPDRRAYEVLDVDFDLLAP